MAARRSECVESGTLRRDLVSVLIVRPAMIDHLSLLLRQDTREIGRALQVLEDAGLVSHSEAGAYSLKRQQDDWQSQARLSQREYYRRQRAFPPPHELDGDWRFTFQSAMDLIHLVKFALPASQSVCCLGTPSIAVLLDILGFDRKVVLIDYNEKTLEAVASTSSRVCCIRCDLMRTKMLEQLGRHDVVFADPPWAGDYCRKFAEIAVSLLREKGVGCLVYFPSYLRRSAPRRQVDLIRTLVRLHSRIITVLPERVGILESSTDTKTRNRYESVQTGARGTVCLFEKVKSSSRCQTDVGWDLPTRSRWRAFYVGTSKWMLRDDRSLRHDASLPSLRKLPSRVGISRYDPVAARAHLWTSGGQLFRVSGVRIVAVLLDGLAKGQSLDDLTRELDEVCPNSGENTRIQRVWIQLKGAARREAALTGGPSSRI
jgi:hypothetical protein